MKITLSVIKADIGGFVGHSSVHPEVLNRVKEVALEAKDNGLIKDVSVIVCGDDIALVMTHTKGLDSSEVHEVAWNAFKEGTEVAKKLKMYGAGQDLLTDAFSGNVKGMGPGVAEMEFEERKSEPVIVFFADKTSPSAWNLPLYEMFADPMNTAGLVIDPSMHDGFIFEVLDVYSGMSIKLSTPEELYDLMVFIGATSRYCVRSVFRKKDGEIGASASTQKLSLTAGRYVGKDDPVLIVRCQSGFPAVGEALEPFARPWFVEGWMRGSHTGPLMPVSFAQAKPTRFDGPPRVIAAGYQICNGNLIGPVDLFDDPAFDQARTDASHMANYLRRQGIFEPHRLPPEEMEYTTLPKVLEKLKDRFQLVDTGKPKFTTEGEVAE
ncbi:fructose-1 6-bisphosphatase [Caldimicrobium thiodismutans]|jgi:fructose 1,6-bisphosphate aldolase/phosphatase|uniref:Fructose-1,6-bisphosphate aldolase/phosphatase n=1 Tax=Caldimicrobium thiodismutans TaxID=1653476 RepID=A0A0U5AEY8_9BACT|nr:fructose-1,6-bisphosphate aldolase/phosphatase [Caldimicrobium thiodismutans]BAU22572.1 fructose-1 6-bisphosphatase [Caldimicrobium thiodismutans]